MGSIKNNIQKLVDKKASEIYMRMKSYSPYKEMNGIPREWIEQKIAEGLIEFNKEHIHIGSIHLADVMSWKGISNHNETNKQTNNNKIN